MHGLYSNTRNDLQDNHSDTTVVMEFAGYGMQDNHSAPASCSASPPEGCKVDEDVSCSVSLDGCWGAADSRQLLLENLQGISESTQGLTRRIPQNK